MKRRVQYPNPSPVTGSGIKKQYFGFAYQKEKLTLGLNSDSWVWTEPLAVRKQPATSVRRALMHGIHNPFRVPPPHDVYPDMVSKSKLSVRANERDAE